MQEFYEEDECAQRGFSIFGKIVAVILIVWMLGYVAVLAVSSIYEGYQYFEATQVTRNCNKWADEAKVYKDYFLLSWQKDQCDAYGIAVDAPVIDNRK